MLTHFHFDSVSSTQDKAFEHLETTPSPFLVSADFQTAGRGRNQREWTMEKGRSLAMTLMISLEAHQLLGITLVAGFSVRNSLRMKDLKVKWPNDLMLADKKVAGILVESRSQGGIAHVAIGVGINLFDLSNNAYAGIQKALNPLEIGERLVRDISVFAERGFKVFQPAYENILWKKGEKVTFKIDGREKDVHVEGVNTEGLLVTSENGLFSITDQGEIIHG